MKTLLIISLCLVSAFNLHACLWIKGTTVDGHKVNIEGSTYSDIVLHAYERDISDLLYVYSAKFNSTDEEILAVKLVLEGKYSQAIETFLGLVKNSNKSYSLAANLGTAYELNGDLENARKWIEIGTQRNPESHHGTEWLHLYILDFKLGKVKRLSEVITFDENSKLEYLGNSFDRKEIYKSISYQLGERLVFVKQNSEIVADLLYCLARLEGEMKVLEPALEVLKIAEKIMVPNQVYITDLKAEYAKIIWTTTAKNWGLTIFGIIVFLIFVCWFMKRFLRNLRAARR